MLQSLLLIAVSLGGLDTAAIKATEVRYRIEVEVHKRNLNPHLPVVSFDIPPIVLRLNEEKSLTSYKEMQSLPTYVRVKITPGEKAGSSDLFISVCDPVFSPSGRSGLNGVGIIENLKVKLGQKIEFFPNKTDSTLVYCAYRVTEVRE
jgi:hypothetical protein